MSKTAKPITEAYDGPVRAILQKYHLLDEAGNVKTVEVRANPEDQESTETETGPMLDEDVINRFLALDTSRNKRVFDWIMYAAGGGADAQEMSKTALGMAHNWVINNRTGDLDKDAIENAYNENPEAFEEFARAKGLQSFDEVRRKRIPFGLNRDEVPIDPMSREEAEQEWLQNDAARYTEAYNFADQDLAADPTYPVFGYYMHWPGRKNVYENVVNAVTAWQGIVNNKKLLQQYNKMMQGNPFQTSLWKQDGSPLFESAEALLAAVKQFKRVFAEKRAQANVQYIGKAKPPGEGFAKGPDEVLYEDDLMKVVIPATAAASLKSGHMDWCISNRTRWDDYFKNSNTRDFMWGSPSYTGAGPFVFWLFKPQFQDRYLQKVAGHFKLNCHAGGVVDIDKIDFWDVENRAAKPFSNIVQRLEQEVPGSSRNFKASLEAVQEWFKQFKSSDVELHPSLESLARKLVDMMLNEA